MESIIGRKYEISKLKDLYNSGIHNVLVTTEGLVYNEYSGFFQNVVTVDDLFNW